MTTGPLPAPRRARVCHIITQLELGGAQQNTLYTLTHLDRRRFEPMLIAGAGGMLDEEAKGIPSLATALLPNLVREVSPLRDLRAFSDLMALMREWRPDLVHTHSSKAGILGRWAAHLSGVPAILHTIHGFGLQAGNSRSTYWLFRGLEAITSPLTTRFLAVSRANLEAAVALGLFPPEKGRVVRSGVDLSAFRNGIEVGDLRASIGIPDDAPVAGMVACLKPQKAPLDFVRAAERVLTRVPSAHFILVGDGVLRPEVERESARLGLTGRLHLLGWRRDVPRIFKILSVVVLTSLWEGLPRVIPEAMAAGLPVVSTRVDGTPEVVAAGETGLLAEPHDIDGLSAAMTELLSDPRKARRMGKEGRSRVDEFDIREMVRRQEELYEELLSPVFRPGGPSRR